jgi:hypothetical protein
MDILHAIVAYFAALFTDGDWLNDWAHVQHMPQALADWFRAFGRWLTRG